MINQKEEIPLKSTGFSKQKTKPSYPFDKLKTGESFDVGTYSHAEALRMSGYLYYYNKSRKNFGRHFCSRKVQAGNDFVLRIYRDDVLIRPNKNLFKKKKK